MIRLADFNRLEPFHGAVFDFNGTLFWDTAQHDQSWIVAMGRRGVEVNADELFARFHGKPNETIIKGLLGEDFLDEEMPAVIEEKERVYQEFCLKENLTDLAPGATRLLDFLKENAFPFTVATSAPKVNIDFYFERLNLGKWFDREKIVFFDGSFPGKPNPEFYQRAMKMIESSPDETIIFEDAPSGILAAENAGCRNIVCVRSGNSDYSSYSYPVLNHFDEISRDIFKT